MKKTDRKNKRPPPSHSSIFRAGYLLFISLLVSGTGCQSVQTNDLLDRVVPTNDRAWVADMQRLSTGEIQGEEVLVRNIRNCQYATANDYVVNYYDRRIRLDELQTVDFIVVPFKAKSLAHTMLSFGLSDGTYLCVSAEIRRELGEAYSPLLGVSNQFELYYLVADERDVIRLRTRYRDAEVYVYPTIATPENTRELFLDVMRRANQLATRPEFYHTVSNNCTTNIVAHVNKLQPQRVPFAWQVLLSGNSAKYAYDLGLLDNRLPFEELQELAKVNVLVDENFDAADFSKRIRSRHVEIAAGLEEAQSAQYEEGDPQSEQTDFNQPLMEDGVLPWSGNLRQSSEGRTSGMERAARANLDSNLSSPSPPPRGGRGEQGIESRSGAQSPQFRAPLRGGLGAAPSGRPVSRVERAVVSGTKKAAKTMLLPPETPVQALVQAALPGSAQARAVRMGVGVAAKTAGELRQIRANQRQ
jgi:hypothetical protein